MAADACEKSTLKMAKLSKKTVDNLREYLPLLLLLFTIQWM